MDIDKLLVVTFTNAAASEMRERVLDAIYKKLDDNPADENLQKQIILLGKSNICTIHSFCLDVIKNNFFEIDLPATFKIASNEEIQLLKQEVLEEVFEELYEAEDETFGKLIESYTGYRGDEPVKDIIFNIYKLIQSTPFPRKWLEEKVEMFHCENYETSDFAGSVWGKILLKDFQEEVLDCMNCLKIVKNKLDEYEEMQKYALTLESDITMIHELQDNCDSWDQAFEFASQMKFKTWPSDKKANPELKEEAKKARDNIKKKLNGLIEKTLIYNSKEAFQDIGRLYDNLVALKNVVLKFDEAFKEKKRNKNIIDFSDIEHYALEILVRQNEEGQIVLTEIAKKYQQKFEEIAIDEYQDSNQVQELILKSVSRGNNIFMVGDVKQSIYKFRQACPELFLEKYNSYSLTGNESGRKIQLFKNFRSKENILNITNIIFENIMSKDLGDIDYTKEEFLNLGADYPQIENGLGKSELHVIDLKEMQDLQEEEDEEFSEENNTKELDKVEIEARFVARKIRELVESKKQITQKDGTFRNIEYRDIVILLRSTSNTAPIFERELVKNNIPVFSDAISEYFDTMEVQTILNVLKVLDNPLDDIKLVAVMRSPIGGFTDNEILEIRLLNREERVYANLWSAKQEKNSCQSKVQKFLEDLEAWKKQSETLSLAELIWKIYIDTGFLQFVGLMPNGILRQANLRMLFERAKEYEKTSFSGLFHFLRFTEKLKSGNSDMASAKVIGESENVVRIMSIHKSKGLEFPVVFLSCTSKKINLQDLKTNLLLHKDIGFGPQYIDYEKKIQYPTPAKQAIKVVGKNEAISEEMRILYVALTRAKEKLIITGTVNQIEKEENHKKDMLAIYENQEKTLNPILLKKYISYLDWIYLVYLSGKLQENLVLHVHDKKEFEGEDIITQTVRRFDFEEKVDFEKIDKNFTWEYPDKKLIDMPVKTTVSQIKENQKEEIENEIGLEEIKLELQGKSHQMTGAQKGTLIHLILQKLDFRKSYTDFELQDFVNQLIGKKIISEQEAKNIDLKFVKNFINAPIYKRIQTAKWVEKEKAFCVSMPMEEYDGSELAIQGMIDLYFIDEKDQLVLLDYKTDLVKDEAVLKNRYFASLEVYKKALEISLNRKVSEVYLYATYLNKLIKL